MHSRVWCVQVVGCSSVSGLNFRFRRKLIPLQLQPDHWYNSDSASESDSDDDSDSDYLSSPDYSDSDSDAEGRTGEE